mmetsp:Transcript_8453/g.11418  ORF Transcript_8453/g.11418 Transcript_8453/m.11418 type:complete len:137 (-) Transcript_8453:171-581(-)|eukprot:CAMPEP_0196582000 /NCGR_PEP_ID=MMETSP1081-20130531/36930_1 /TAXON_ID=36882 /ORGANISM="Pyramimonas amylifera, Strain CCMP720" /LENGTH=136 /DNA_ID=CAMNT_0041902451 /DNA_START=80 /DNA_END=490 /DNA_ORIENTATION=+
MKGGQAHSQVMNPYSVDQSWRERVQMEQGHAKTFWGKQPEEIVDKLGMEHTRRIPETLIPRHAQAPSAASSIISHRTQKSKGPGSYASTRTTAKSESTQALFERMESLEKRLLVEKTRREEVERKVRELSKISVDS